MKRTALKRYTPLKSQSTLNRSGFSKKPKIKKSDRSKKIARNKDLRAQYDLPKDILPTRWGTKKSHGRLDYLKGVLWTVFARYVRRRDQGGCISCGRYKTYEELQGGHYAPVGGNDLELCFDETNVNGECEGCNGFDQMHLVFMRPRLIAKWGMKNVERIEKQRQMKRVVIWSELDYVKKIHYYYDKLKEINH